MPRQRLINDTPRTSWLNKVLMSLITPYVRLDGEEIWSDRSATSYIKTLAKMARIGNLDDGRPTAKSWV